MDNLEHANQRDRIVIIGMACRYPGANDYKEYWDNLVNGKNLIKEIPRMRWDTSRYYNENINTPNTSMSKWCGIVDEIETFDYKFFSISEREAKNMDPQQRLLLQETWHCIEDSAVLLKELQEKRQLSMLERWLWTIVKKQSGKELVQIVLLVSAIMRICWQIESHTYTICMERVFQ